MLTIYHATPPQIPNLISPTNEPGGPLIPQIQASLAAIGGHCEALITQNEPFQTPKHGCPTQVVGPELLLELELLDDELLGLLELELELLGLLDDELGLLELLEELELELELLGLLELELLGLLDDELGLLELLEELELLDDEFELELELLDEELLELELLGEDELGIEQQHSIGGIICSTCFQQSTLLLDCQQ